MGEIGARSVTAVGGSVLRLAAARIRSDWQYRTSFVMFMTSQATVAVTELAAILILVDVAPSIGGWEPLQVIALYGLVFVSFGIGDLLASAATDLETYVKSGRFDRLLLRPMPSLLQLLSLEFQVRRIGKVVPPVVALALALARSDLAWGPGPVAYLVMTLASGGVIFSALFIAAGATCFWVIDGSQATNAITYGGSTAAQYPLHIMPVAMRTLLGWVFPVAFAGYIPAIHLLDAPNPLDLPDWLAYAPAPVAAACLAAAITTWRLGVRNYHSTGS